MIDRDQTGFVTLHTGRPPILERVAWVMVLVVTVVILWSR